MNNFIELTSDEMLFVGGGIDWNSFGIGTAMTAGGLSGVAIGAYTLV